jgi:hypothetical protein
VGLGARTPLPPRASARERERVIRRLRQSLDDDRLSLETFAARLESVYAAKTRVQLAELVADLPERRLIARAVIAALAGTSRWAARAEAIWREPRTPRLVLSLRDRATVGRAADCDCVLGDPTVSRTHALLRYSDGRWWLRDLGSSNGTWLNRWRIVDEVEVRPGDDVAFGGAEFRLTAPSFVTSRGSSTLDGDRGGCR